MKQRARACGLLLLLFGVATTARANAVLTVVNGDGPGEGFNDPTVVAPIGGNKGTTRGAQRLIAFQHAADLWGTLLDSDVPIVINATFDTLDCSTNAVLGQANTSFLRANFAGAPLANTWYPAALADRLARVDLDPGQPDIVASFNSAVDGVGCLASSDWYYGLDAKHGNDQDLVTVVLHELGHGLGSSTFMDVTTGQFPGVGTERYPPINATFTLDREFGKHWSTMLDAERLASATNVRQVIWDGPLVSAAISSFLQPGMPSVNTAPAVVGLSGAVGLAEFGPALGSPPVTAPLVLVSDGVGTVTDGCEALVGLTGKIALIDRGTCFFTVKVKNAQDAGAIAVLIADNVDGAPPAGLAASANPPAILIPSVRISKEDGVLLKAALLLGSVSANVGIDLLQRAGEAPGGGIYLNAVAPIEAGSSISHWDPIATPNLLMEPAINADLAHTVDLTLPQLRDIGWAQFICGDDQLQPGEDCDDGPANSDTAIDACRSDCQAAHCGDSVKDTGEACDDGNVTSGDGCDQACVVEFCGDGKRNASVVEECDDGALNSDLTPDACRMGCLFAHCADGVVDSSETCDDANLLPNDGCDANCQVEVDVPPVEPSIEPMPDAGAASGGAPDPNAPPTAADAVPDAGAGFDAAVAAGGARTDSSVAGMVGATPDAPALTTGNGEVEDLSARDAGVVPSDNRSGCGCSVPGAQNGRRARVRDSALLALLGLAWSRRRRESSR